MKSVIFVTELDSSIAVEQRKVPENIFHEKTFFFLRNKNMSHIVSDIVAGVGALWDLSKSSKSMIFDKNQWKSRFFMKSVIFVMELDSSIAVE